MPTLLHVGCGGDSHPPWFDGHDETRLDINPDVQPDIVASMVDLGEIGLFDVVYCSHALEHLYPQDVQKALSEFHRVLKPGGYAMVLVPDLEDVRPTEEVVYISGAGPISGLDMYYGKADLLEANPFMAHHCGFVKDTLGRAMGMFSQTVVTRLMCHNLMGIGIK